MERRWLVTYHCDANAKGVDIDAWKAVIERVTPIVPGTTILTIEGTKITIHLIVIAVDPVAALRTTEKGLKRSMRRMGFTRSLDEILTKITIGKGDLVSVLVQVEGSK